MSKQWNTSWAHEKYWKSVYGNIKQDLPSFTASSLPSRVDTPINPKEFRFYPPASPLTNICPMAGSRANKVDQRCHASGFHEK